VGYAAWNGHLPVLRLMVRKYGCSVEERTKVGEVFTHSMLWRLLIYRPLQDGWAPLHYSARYGHLHIVKELIEKMNADLLVEIPVCVNLFDIHSQALALLLCYLLRRTF